ncbi:hypothetical protein, partial [Vibrio nigripulchritudo]|uniref:hypothetical protein n=1 Tax=Vibrio nigripulchritudo TaxID=28173 RepID=UPI000AF79E6B
RFMGRHCSKEWGDLAEKLLEEKAVNGDYKARYALSLYRGRKTEKDYDEAAEIAIESAKNNYLAPLVSIALWHRDVNDKEVMEIEKEILKLILSNYYPPALTMLHYSEYDFSQAFKENIYETYSLIVGHRDMLIRKYYGNEYQGNREVLLFSLAASMLSNTYKNKHGGGLRLWEFERKYLGRGNSFTKEELDKANTIFEKMKKKSTPVIYIDEVEPRKYF